MAQIEKTLKVSVFSLIFLQCHFLCAQLLSEKEFQANPDSANHSPKGYFISAEGFYSVALEGHPLGANIVNGYLFKNGISAGLGLGADVYRDGIILLPLTADLRYFFLNDKKNSPVLNLSGGYAFNINGDIGGTVIHPSVGIRSQLSKKLFLISSLGYETEQRSVDWDKGVVNFVNFHFITLNIGVLFN